MAQYPVLSYEHMQYSYEARSSCSVEERNTILGHTRKAEIVLPACSKCAVKPFPTRGFQCLINGAVSCSDLTSSHEPYSVLQTCLREQGVVQSAVHLHDLYISLKGCAGSVSSLTFCRGEVQSISCLSCTHLTPVNPFGSYAVVSKQVYTFNFESSPPRGNWNLQVLSICSSAGE